MKKLKLLCLSVFLMTQTVHIKAEAPDPVSGFEEPSAEALTPEESGTDPAEETPAPEESEEPVSQESEEPSVADEDVSDTDIAETPEPAAETQETAVPQATEEPMPESGEEVSEESEGDAYFTKDEIDYSFKQKLAESDVLAELSLRTAGTDYAADEVILLTSDPSYAERAAAAYEGTLIRYDGRVAVIRLPEGRSVYDAVEAGMDMETAIPAVDVNWYVYLDEPAVTMQPSSDIQLFSVPSLTLPAKTTWSYWVESLDMPDPFLEQVYSNGVDDYPWQWYHETLGSWEAWGVSTGNPEVRVGVIDSGVQADHEELAGKVTLRQVGDIDTSPSSGHGTHVAGIIAGELGNGCGGAGIAPDVSIYSYNVFRTSSSAAAADISSAILMAAEDGMWVINMSFGTASYSAVVQEAVDTAYESGCTVIAAMGNYGSNLKVYPAALEHVISVTASDRLGRRTAFSNYGDWADIAAPGTEMSSSYYYRGSTSGYTSLQGTSMSSPVVAGSAALYMSVYGHRSPDEMEQILEKNTENGVLSLKQMFGRKETAPQILFDEDTNQLTIEKTSDDERAVIVYTLNGKNPVVKNGVITRGTIYDGVIDLSGKPADTVLTVKSFVVSGNGRTGNMSTMKIMIHGPQTQISGRKVKSVTFENSKLKLNYSEAEAETAVNPVTRILLDDGSYAQLSDYDPDDYQWYSEKPGIASVDEDGNVTAQGKGSTYICLRFRFQNFVKTVKYKVTVSRLADSITVKGRQGIVADSSFRLTASFLPSNTSDQSVEWAIESVSEPGYESYVSVNRKGKLTVKKGIPAGTEITVRCTAKDGSGVSALKTVTVCTPAKSVTIRSDGKKITSAVLFNADLPETYEIENMISLSGTVNTKAGESEAAPVWTSSRPKVATVDADGNVTALKKGTTVITCKAADGTGKKAAVKLTVKVPTSGVFITAPALNWNAQRSANYLALGKTCKLKAQAGSVYGKPSNSAVKWNVEEVSLNGMDWTDEAKSMKLVKVSSKGAVMVSSKLLSRLGIETLDYGYVVVSATAKDGTEHYDDVLLYLTPKIKEMVMKVLMSGGKVVEIEGKTIQVTQNKSITLYAYMDQNPQSVSVKSDNPNICGARVDKIETTEDGVRAVIKVTGGTAAGEGVITVTENGSGLKRTVKIKVKPA